jgi:glutathione S-transferase
LLELADGRHLAESNAILCYLGDGSELAGSDRFERARILQWMFFEQYWLQRIMSRPNYTPMYT